MKTRIVTPEQYRQGYQVFLGLDRIPNVAQRSFNLVRRLNDGNYEVEEPEVEQEKLRDE